jgi:hypothetical protein
MKPYYTCDERRIFYYNKFKELVDKRKGTLLSTVDKYINAQSKLTIKCHNDHIFDISLNNLNHNRWCPQCRLNVGELICKAAIEHLLEEKFIKIKPKWLKSDKNTLLELDMYNDDLKIAVEYNGIQHYKEMKHFHRTPGAFKYQQERDQLKIELCFKNDVLLIIVPYTIDNDNICEYLANKLIENYIYIDKDLINTFDTCDIFNKLSKWKEFQKLIESKNGKIIGGSIY